MVSQRTVQTSSARQRTRTNRIYSPAVLLGCAIMASGGPTQAANEAPDIELFRLMSVDGTVAVRYLLDDQERGSGTATDSFETRSTWEEEFFLMTQSFIYHPGFLNMNIGGGPLLVQQQFDSNLGDNNTREALFNFLTELNFLSVKNYPFSVYYERSHPSISTSLSGRFLTENNVYGFRGALNDFWSATTLNVNLSHRDTVGSGLGTTVDEDIDQATLLARKSYRGSDQIELEYNWSIRDSSSGSPGLPIQQSRITTTNTDVTARNTFGSDRQLALTQYLRRYDQETLSTTVSELENWIYTADVRWDHTESTRSFLRYGNRQTKRTGADASSQEMQLGTFHNTRRNLNYQASLDYARDEQIGFHRDLGGVQGSVSYTRPTAFGSLGLGASVRGELSDQQADADTVQVFDERLILVGTTPVNLANDFVITDTVIIRNLPQTQVFVEGLDYRLVTVGSVTSVQRLVNGNIADGQTVLAEYQYRTSGTVEFDTMSSGITASANFLRHFNAYLKYNRRDNNVRSGEPTTPLNDLDVIELALQADYPIGPGWAIGGEIRHVDQDEDISPFVRNSVDAYVNITLPWSYALRLGSNITQVDNENSVEDVDLVSYRLGLSGWIWGGARLSYEANFLRDVGGTLPREQVQHRLNIQWAYRQLRFFVRAQTNDHLQGETERRNTQITAQVMRAF